MMGRLAKILAAFAMTAALALPAPAQALEKATIGYNAVADFLLGFIAKDQGFFEQHGLDAELKLTQVSLVAIPTVLTAGSIDIGGVTPPAILLADEQGLDIKIIAGADQTAAGYHLAGIIVRPDSDIKTAADLKGKNVAVPGLNDLLHILVVKWLTDRGVAKADVHFVEQPMVQLGDVLKSGRVDAVVPVEPFMSRIVNSGGGRILSYYVDDLPAGIPPVVWASTGKYAASHPAVIKAFRAGIADAFDYYKAHPDLGPETMSHYVKIPLEVLKTIPIPPMTASVDASQIRYWVDIMRQQQMLAKPVDPASVLAP
ncbi:MAG TPA: ABC transporter substrate-binding protein [Stellaceae bacterium]|jgi:NitT/TauT family transport system substrate-binding protein|nr:ABC transporter substrate-binding protein [Stellaceae bacterium]